MLFALKEYKASVLEIPGQLERIRQESTLMAKIEHPNVVRSYGLLPSRAAIALHLLEWVDGPTLQNWVKTAPDEGYTWEALRSVALGVLDGLDTLHSRSILHRDLKSENVLMAGTVPKITDLGIAEARSDENATMHTQVKDFIGSIRFASPNFVRGENFVVEDDVYGYGTIFFELCTGSQVYEEVVRKTLLTAEILARAPKIPSLRQQIPGPVRTLLQGCLHPDRKRRPTTAQLRDGITSPETSKYVQSELDAQNRAQRGYAVVSVDSDGKNAFVDLRGEDDFSGFEEVWRIVRRLHKVNVPSAGGDVEPECWIADVHIKHVHGGLAYCMRVTRHWQNDPGSRSQLGMFGLVGPSGHWDYSEPTPSKIQVGDLLVKR
jgi:serine/threonine protein kinase